MESLRNWLRDHLCTRAVAVVGLGYAALSALLELPNLLLGLSGIDAQITYDINRYLVYVRGFFALLAGPLAFWLYYRRSGNTHRLTPFVTLSRGLFIAVKRRSWSGISRIRDENGVPKGNPNAFGCTTF